MIYRFDADLNGTDSIAPYIESGRIKNLSCPTFEDFETHRVWLQQNVKPGDWVILDTMSTMLSTTRMDRVVGNKIDEKLSTPEKVNKFFGDKEYLAVYNFATQMTLRALKNMRARGIRVICLCHESEITDPMAQMKMAGPQVNPAMVDELIAASSDVFRLRALTEPITDNTGTVQVITKKNGQKVALAKDTRLLYLRRTDAFTAKFHVARERSESIPAAIVDPTIAELFDILGKESSWLTIYGHPGAGKTSLAATLADYLDSVAA